jgi:hypothetical protein
MERPFSLRPAAPNIVVDRVPSALGIGMNSLKVLEGCFNLVG